MFDIDYAPGVFAGIIFFVVILPALYGIFFVDAYYEKHQKEEADDAFN